MKFAKEREMRIVREYIVFAKAFLGKVFGKGAFAKNPLKSRGLRLMSYSPKMKSPKTLANPQKQRSFPKNKENPPKNQSNPQKRSFNRCFWEE